MSSTDKAKREPGGSPRTGQDLASTPIDAAVRAAEDKKAIDLRVLDLEPICDIADCFLIATGANERQVQAIADSIREDLRACGCRPLAVEGYRTGSWVLLDYGDLVAHVFKPQTRSFYELERLWSDAEDITPRFASPAPTSAPSGDDRAP